MTDHEFQEQRMHKKAASPKQRGFTLMELMVVVVIIGVLSAVAIPSISKFITRSKESEASHNLAAVFRGAQQFFSEERTNLATGIVTPARFPQSGQTTSVVWMPTQLPCREIVGSPKYARNSARWATIPWRDLKFSLATSHYFRYGYSTNDQTGTAATFSAQAEADLNCNTTRSNFTLNGNVVAATGEVQRSAVITTNEGE